MLTLFSSQALLRRAPLGNFWQLGQQISGGYSFGDVRHKFQIESVGWGEMILLDIIGAIFDQESTDGGQQCR